jgi:hypothetical protein
MVGGGGKCVCGSERGRGGGATVIPLFSSVSSALEVVRLANKTYRDDETTYFVRWLGGFAAASSAIFIALVFLINMLINLYVN